MRFLKWTIIMIISCLLFTALPTLAEEEIVAEPVESFVSEKEIILEDNTVTEDFFLESPEEAIHHDEKAVMASSDFTFDGSVLKEYNGNDAFVTIPSDVTSISSRAFAGKTFIQSVTIPYGITTIGADAFRDCTGLRIVELPESLVSIGGGAFRGCVGIQKLVLPSSVVTLDAYAFCECSGLSSFTIKGSSLRTIGEYCFSKCEALEAITLPDSVTSIGEYAFYMTYSLNTIDLGNKLSSLGNYAFYDSALKSITIPASLDCLPYGVFQKCDIMTSIILSEGLEIIDDNAFRQCKKLQSVNLPSTVTYLGDYAFADCAALTTFTISGNGLKYIGESCFSNCTALQTIALPNSVNYLDDGAFSYSGIRSISIPGTIATIPDNAFYKCKSLKNVTINKGVTSISNCAFDYCESLIGVEIPDSVTEIGNYSFGYCTSLKYAVIPVSVTVIENYAFYNDKSLTAYVDDNSFAYNYCIDNSIPHKRIGEPLPHDHDPSIIPGYAATCTDSGLSDGSICKICGETLAEQNTIPATGHVAVVDPYIPPTLTSTGLTKGYHCSVCGTILVERQTIPMLTAPTKITLNKTKATLGANDTVTLKARLTPADTKTKLTWKSNKPKVAKVSTKGVVTALKKGTAIITVTAENGKKATAKITVKPGPKTITLYRSGKKVKAGATLELKKGKSLALKAKLPSGTLSTLTWSSNKPKVAKVSKTGKITALKAGAATITVKAANGTKVKVKIRVK